MEIEDTQRLASYGDVRKESSAIADLRKELGRHEVYEASRAERQEWPIIIEGNLALGNNRMFREDDVKHGHRPRRENLLSVRTESDGMGKCL